MVTLIESNNQAKFMLHHSKWQSHSNVGMNSLSLQCDSPCDLIGIVSYLG